MSEMGKEIAGSVADAVAEVMGRVGAAAHRSGRPPEAVRVVAAVKTIEPARIEEALAAGITDLGENDAKDLAVKAQAIGPGARWHYLGVLQTNKVRYLDSVKLVHSLHRDREAEALQTSGQRCGRAWDVLVEVNIAGEHQKQGIAPDDVEGLLERLAVFPLVQPRGFMFVAPQAQNPEDVRWLFAEGRRLRERFGRYGLDELSMGMSDDFEVAIEEGATIVRIGRAIFGQRRKAGVL